MKIRILLSFIFFITVSISTQEQLHHEIREDHELGKEFHFTVTEDSIHYRLTFVQTAFIDYDQVSGKMTLVTSNLKAGKTDSLKHDVYCSRIPDILEEDSTGYSYNPKVCNLYKNKLEYSLDFKQSRTDYPSVSLTIFDPKKREVRKSLILIRKND